MYLRDFTLFSLAMAFMIFFDFLYSHAQIFILYSNILGTLNVVWTVIHIIIRLEYELWSLSFYNLPNFNKSVRFLPFYSSSSVCSIS